jgi:hypothetical protein
MKKPTTKSKKPVTKKQEDAFIEVVDLTNMGIPARDLKKNMGCGG